MRRLDPTLLSIPVMGLGLGWRKRLKAAIGVAPKWNREHEAERRRQQIAKGMLKVG